MIRVAELVITVSKDKDKYKNITQVEKIDFSSTC